MKIVKAMGNGESAKALLDMFAKKWPGHKWPLLLKGAGYKISIETIHQAHSNEQRNGFFLLLNQWIEKDERLMRDILPARFHNEPVKQQAQHLRNEIYMFHFGKLYVTDKNGNEIAKPVRTTTSVWSWKHGCYLDESLSMDLYSGLIERVYQLAAERDIILPPLERNDDTHKSA